jgi:UDP-2-acetamido-3-amino-2,3-dideoxy-glucuronate N-acetyltransferase
MSDIAAPAPFAPRTRQGATFLEELLHPAARPQPQPSRRCVAVVGTGCWGKDLVRTFAGLGALRAVCDSDPTALAALPNGTVKHYSRFEDCLADPEITAVAIATPVVSHFELARAALMSGKDVFVEKPLALTARDGRALVVLAAASNRILMTGNALRYDPGIGRLKEMIDGGELGRVEYIYSSCLSVDQQRAEESILWSLAPYEVSIILGLLAEMPESVSCHGGDYVGSGVSDVTISQYAFAGGVRAQVFVSRLRPFREQRLVVVGSEKMAVFDLGAASRLVTYPRREGQGQLTTRENSGAEPVPVESVEPMEAECRTFIESVETRQPPATDGRSDLRELEVLDACIRSLSSDGLRTAVRPPADNHARAVLLHGIWEQHEQPAHAGTSCATA